jgi:glycosyltransferase involved in cell wall biosynthesis
VRDGVNGFLCEPDRPDQFIERAAQMAADVDLTRRLSAEARRTATEEFNIDLYIDHLCAYYERVLERELPS